MCYYYVCAAFPGNSVCVLRNVLSNDVVAFITVKHKTSRIATYLQIPDHIEKSAEGKRWDEMSGNLRKLADSSWKYHCNFSSIGN